VNGRWWSRIEALLAKRVVQCSEAGDTLIEILIAIVIIALTVTALLGALVTAITSSTTQQSLATVDSVLNGFAQSALYEVQQSNVFKNCTTTPYRLIGAPTPATGPAGSSATVFVTGLAANHSLSVTLGSTAATVTSGSMTDGNGDAAVTFTVPNGVNGSQIVTVNDGNPTPSPTAFTVGGSVKGTTPVGYSILVDNPVQQWDAQNTDWVNATSANCPMSGSQQITVVARAPDGSSGSLSFVALGPATTTVLVTATSSSMTPTLGDTLTFTAKVVPPNSTTAPPTGNIQWTFGSSPGSPSCANSALSTIGGTNTSQATCTVSAAQVGTYSVTAGYPAPGTTGNYGPGSGTGGITVGKATSSTSVTEVSSPSPAQPGSKLTFTATVGATPAVGGDPKPAGTLVWSITAPAGASSTCQGLTNNTFQMPPGGTGTNTATCVLPNGAAGNYTATATYGGDGNYTNSQASSPPTVVSQASATPSFSTVPSNPQPGSNFTVTLTVTGNGTITPTGSVTWTITAPSGPNPNCPTSQMTSNGTGVNTATCVVANPVAGQYSVSTVYSGDTSYKSSQGATGWSTQIAVTLAPAGFDIQGVPNSPADGRPDNLDQIVYTYNQTMSANSILNGWTGSSRNVTAQFSRQNGQSTSLQICTSGSCNTVVNLGTVSLGDPQGNRYMNGGSVNVNATMVMTANGSQSVVTITLTQTAGGLSALSPADTTTTLMWSPSAAATNATGTACSTTARTESGAPKRNF
jgi:type II secretory pathway pseudopilin PulG